MEPFFGAIFFLSAMLPVWDLIQKILWYVLSHMLVNRAFACQVECCGVDYVSDVR